MKTEELHEIVSQTVKWLKLSTCALFLGLVTTTFLSANEQSSGKLLIDKPNIPASPPGSRVAAGYMSITNHMDQTETLLSVNAEFAKMAEIHEIKEENGVAKMRELKSPLRIAAGETVMLAPGSFHLMFMGVTEPLVVGETASVVLEFERSGQQTIEFSIVDRRKTTHGHNNHEKKHKDIKLEDMKIKHKGMKHGDTEVN